MQKEKKEISLPEGNFETEIVEFNEDDKKTLRLIYRSWRELSKLTTSLGGRSINLPEILSEGLFCLEMNSVRISKSIKGANSSFDAFDLNRNKRIQVKAASVLPDLTSFGPKSVWDELYFMNFSKLDGTFEIYLIPSESIYSFKVNESQTVKDQQNQGRRPRFSIYKEIILKEKIEPIKVGNIN